MGFSLPRHGARVRIRHNEKNNKNKKRKKKKTRADFKLTQKNIEKKNLYDARVV